MNVSFGSTLDATSGIASLTGYKGEAAHLGMDVNYPDQIVSLFATGIVITAVMEARRSGKGRSSTSRSARSRPSPWARRFWPHRSIRLISLRRADTEAGVPQQDAYRCKDGRWIAVTDSDPGSPPIAPRRTAMTPWRRSLRAGLRPRRAATAVTCCTIHESRRRYVGPRRTWWAGEGLPYRLDGKGIAIERAAPDLGQHTDAVLRELLGYGDAGSLALKKSGVTSTTAPTVGDV